MTDELLKIISEAQDTRWIDWHTKYQNVLSIIEYYDLETDDGDYIDLDEFEDYQYNEVKLSAINEAIEPLGKLALPILIHDSLDYDDFSHFDHFEPHDGGIVYYLVIVNIKEEGKT